MLERFLAGRLDRAQSVGQNAGEDRHHLPVAVIGRLELAAHLFHCRRQDPAKERRAVAQSARLAGQHRHVVPGIVDDLVAAEAAGMLADDHAVLADNDPVGIAASAEAEEINNTVFELLG